MKRKVKLITILLLITLLVGGLSGCSSNLLRTYTVKIDIYDYYDGYESGYVYLEGNGTKYAPASDYATFYGVYQGQYDIIAETPSGTYTDTMYVEGSNTTIYHTVRHY